MEFCPWGVAVGRGWPGQEGPQPLYRDSAGTPTGHLGQSRVAGGSWKPTPSTSVLESGGVPRTSESPWGGIWDQERQPVTGLSLSLLLVHILVEDGLEV